MELVYNDKHEGGFEIMGNFMENCPAGVYQSEITLLPEHTDCNGTVTPGALARIMQEVTEAHMKQAGLGYQKLREDGLLWFIVWTSVWIEEIPKLDGTYVIRTWPGEVKLGMYSRRYAFYTPEGTEILKTSSLFMMIDEATRKMVPPSELPSELAEIVMEGQPLLPKQRIKFPELPLAQDHVVADYEIDKNGHVNNAYYLDWAYSLVDTEYMQKHPLKFFWVQYSKELMLGQTVKMQHTVCENEFYVKGVADDNVSFQVKMDFAQ